MNKFSKVRYISDYFNTRFRKGKIYTVVAGLGDGNPANRSNGGLGAMITDEETFVVEGDDKTLHQCSMRTGHWELVEEADYQNAGRVTDVSSASQHIYAPEKKHTDSLWLH
ncbi:hypothetical protein HWC59_gp17 [Proteus phage Myduc]|uniref:Uncharacterized protein n=1 Tax=Proteus phage Myduc TaxID=2650874 RepID=A0A5J6T7B4_9CAUD|nr:hypothetical protein HWC59_gp17 [Proteus phage Myduc]QFG06640.1 hypothetical protein CPT_Myduc_017 [Proteus phage Myduc]